MIIKSIDKRIMTYSSVALMLSLLAILLRTICLFTSFEADIGYYKVGFLSSVLGAFLFLSAIYFISAFFTIPDSTACATGREVGIGIRGTGALCAFAFIYVAVNSAISALGGQIKDMTPVLVLSAIAILAATYFILYAVGAKNTAVHAVFGFAVTIYCVAVVILTYFDLYELMNGPNKITMQMALLSGALFFLGEIRAYADELKKGYYVATLTSATFFCGVSSVPTLIWGLATGNVNRYSEYHVMTFVIFLYLVARLFSFVINSVKDDNAESEMIDEETGEAAE